VPIVSFLGDSEHVPLADFSLITHSVVAEVLIVTVPLGVVPECWGKTVTERSSVCSSP
jgi:hypothetical protein